MADEQQPPHQPREPAGQPDRTGADETRQMPAAGADETRKIPRDGDTEAPPAAPRWSGRAGVPPPEAFVVREAAPTEEDMAAGRRWWLPVVLALLALVLLALLGVGLWLVMRSNDDPAPSTPVTPALTASATPAQPSPSTPDTSSAATTAAPSPSVAAQVVVPRLVGIDGNTAQSILDALGLTPRLSARPDPLARPGTVLETDPAEGSMVPAGTEVTLVIAAAPPSPSPPAPPSPAFPSPPVPTRSR